MPKITQDVHEKVLTKVQEILAKYKFSNEDDRQFLEENIDIFYAPDLELNAGQIFEDYSVALNPYILMKNVEMFIENTVVHEIVHAIQMRCFPGFRQVHGKEFKQILKSLGLIGYAQCSDYDLSGLPPIPGRHVYSCCCNVFHFPTITHNRIVRGEIRQCTKCDEIVKLKGT